MVEVTVRLVTNRNREGKQRTPSQPIQRKQREKVRYFLSFSDFCNWQDSSAVCLLKCKVLLERTTGASQAWLPCSLNSGIKTKSKTAPADGGGCLAPGPLVAPFVRQQCHLLAKRSKPELIFASLNECSFLPPPRQGTLCAQGRKMKNNRPWTNL